MNEPTRQYRIVETTEVLVTVPTSIPEPDVWDYLIENDLDPVLDAEVINRKIEPFPPEQSQ